MTAFILALGQHIGATALLLGVVAFVGVVVALVACLSAKLFAGAIEIFANLNSGEGS